MKKLWRAIVAAAVVLCLCAGLTACSGLFAEDTQGDGAESEEQVSESMLMYREAVEEGYTGTYLDFIEQYRTRKDSVAAEDGNAAAEIKITDEGDNPGADIAALSVVKVTSAFTYGSAYPARATVLGAGVVYAVDEISNDMYVVTNYHVVYDSRSTSGGSSHISDEIYVWLFGGETESCKLSASYVGGVMDKDIAVLFIDGEDSVAETGGLSHTNASVIKDSAVRPAKIGDSDAVSVGDRVFAIGNPNGKGVAVTQGIVSVKCEQVTMDSLDGARTVTSYEIRTDAAINHGNSGGGLFNQRGELVGIVNARSEEDGVRDFGYAIPSNLALSVAENIMGTGGKGASRAILGFSADVIYSHSVYDAGTLAADCEQVVSLVYIGGAAANILESGDVLVSVTLRGKKTAITNTIQLVRLSYDLRAGDSVEYEILRNGTALVLTVTYGNTLFVTEK